MIKKKGGDSKNWDDLSLNQKRHRLFSIAEMTLLRFWYVCGKDSQRYYQNIEKYTEDNIDEIRDKMYLEYITKIELSDVKDKIKKKTSIYNFLYGKITKENN